MISSSCRRGYAVAADERATDAGTKKPGSTAEGANFTKKQSIDSIEIDVKMLRWTTTKQTGQRSAPSQAEPHGLETGLPGTPETGMSWSPKEVKI